MSTGTNARIDRDNLADHLRSLGYKPTPIASDTWRAHLTAAGRTFPLLVRAHAGYLTFAIVPLFKTPEDSTRAAALYDELLRLNHVLMLAKFSIDDDLDVVLSVEYPLGMLDPSEVSDALSALSHYADVHFAQLQLLLG
jgi:hypothetical protein